MKTELLRWQSKMETINGKPRTPCTGAESSNSALDDSRQGTALLFCFTFARSYGVIYLPDLYKLEPVLSHGPCIQSRSNYERKTT